MPFAVMKSEAVPYGDLEDLLGLKLFGSVMAIPSFLHGGTVAVVDPPSVLIADFSSVFNGNRAEGNVPSDPQGRVRRERDWHTKGSAAYRGDL